MLDTTKGPLSDFQFTIIGQQPPLLDRLSDPYDSFHPSSSPPSSPRLPVSAMTPSSSRPSFIEAHNAVPDDANTKSYQTPTLQQYASQSFDSGSIASRDTSYPNEEPNTVSATRRYRGLPAPASSRASPPLVNISTDIPAPIVRASSSGTKSSNSLVQVQGHGTTLAGSQDALSSQPKDAIESLRQRFRHLQEEYSLMEQDSRQAMARQRDQAARWHARADRLVDSMKTIFSQAEGPITRAEQRAVQSEAEVQKLHVELQKTCSDIARLKDDNARLESDNAKLCKELELQRIQAVEARRSDEARVSKAIKEAEDAIKQVALRESEWEKTAEEAEACWKAREEALLLQLTRAGMEKEEIQSQLDEQKRLAEEDTKRRIAEVTEEKRRIEQREAEIKVELDRQRLARGSREGQYGPVSHSVVGDRHQLNAASHRRRGREVPPSIAEDTEVPSIGASDSPSQVARALVPRTPEIDIKEASQEGDCMTPTFDPPVQIEPLLAVKFEETECPVKPEMQSPLAGRTPRRPISRERSERLPRSKPRREQSLDYAIYPLVASEGGITSRSASDLALDLTAANPANTDLIYPASTSSAPASEEHSPEQPTMRNCPSRNISISSGDPDYSRGNPSAGPHARVFSQALQVTQPQPGLSISASSPTLDASRAPITSTDRYHRPATPRPWTTSSEAMSLEDIRGRTTSRQYSDHHSPSPLRSPNPVHDHDCSPEQTRRRVDHWSPTPGRPPRYKRTRDEDDSSKSNARRPRLDYSEGDAFGTSDTSSNQRNTARSQDRATPHDDRRDYNDHRYEPEYREHAFDAARNSPPRERSPSPSYPPHPPKYGYAPTHQPTADFTETEARLPQVVQQQGSFEPTPYPKVATQSASTNAVAHAKPPAPRENENPASTKKTLPCTSRTSPQQSSATPAGISTEIPLLNRLSEADTVTLGVSSEGVHQPLSSRVARGRGTRGRGRGRRAHNDNSAAQSSVTNENRKTRLLADRIDYDHDASGDSLVARIS